ncbi:MAG: DegT/DnrJ/EryC1/StrS family aminotransferase [Solirubrobacterales bacterium]
MTAAPDTAIRSSVPLFATRPAIEPLIGRIAERQRAVLDSGRYILGPEVEQFESEFAAYIGRRHCVGVANGTDAITIALRSLGIGEPRDEVIVPGVSFFATAEAVVNAGARPVFADIDPATHCMTAETVAPHLSPWTKAIVPVHLFGNPAPVDEITALAIERGIPVVEDAAQAAGALLGERRAGALGEAATFSFYPGKNLGAVGDAGAIVTDDDRIAATARSLRAHGGGGRPWRHEHVGYNSRLDEIQAAALRVLLPELDGWIEARRAAARAYEGAGIGELARIQTETPGGSSAYHLYVVVAEDRDRLCDHLAACGIESRPYYTTTLDRQPALKRYRGNRRLAASERLAGHGLALPMGQCLTVEDAERVVGAIRTAR